MAYSTTDSSRYPIYIVQIWAAALANGTHTIPCPDKKFAGKVRLQLNSYRTACRNSESPLAKRYDAMEIIIRAGKNNSTSDITLGHNVIIRSVDDSEVAQALAASLEGIDLGNLTTTPTEWEETPDSEEALDTTMPGEIKPGGSVF